MKKTIYIPLILFVLGIFVGYENPELVINTKKNFKYFFKTDETIQKTFKVQEIKEDIINANSFDVSFTKKMTFENQSAALLIDKNNNLEMIRSDGKIENLDEIKDMRKTFNFYEKKSGGVRAAFVVKNKKFIWQANKSLNCFYASLVRVEDNKELLKTDCLPDEENIDFSGLGGGHVFKDGYIYLAIGTPTHKSSKIDNLSQNLKSFYGKIIKFKVDDLINKNIVKINYEIVSLGHRNPQGLAVVGENIYGIEHGPRGGDEINLIKENKNYGWPIYSMGITYEKDKKFLHVPLDKKYSLPLYAFLPAIAPSDLSRCPTNLEKYYSEFDCLLALSLRGMSFLVILIDKDKKSVVSIEQIVFGERLRKFGRNELMNLYEKDNNIFYVTTDQNNIYGLKFTNFVKNEKN